MSIDVLNNAIAELALVLIGMSSATAVLWVSICTLNFMSPGTRIVSRLAYILLGVGAAGFLLAPPLIGYRPDPGTVFLLAGVAAVLADGRNRAMRRRHSRPPLRQS